MVCIYFELMNEYHTINIWNYYFHNLKIIFSQDLTHMKVSLTYYSCDLHVRKAYKDS